MCAVKGPGCIVDCFFLKFPTFCEFRGQSHNCRSNSLDRWQILPSALCPYPQVHSRFLAKTGQRLGLGSKNSKFLPRPFLCRMTLGQLLPSLSLSFSTCLGRGKAHLWAHATGNSGQATPH